MTSMLEDPVKGKIQWIIVKYFEHNSFKHSFYVMCVSSWLFSTQFNLQWVFVTLNQFSFLCPKRHCHFHVIFLSCYRVFKNNFNRNKCVWTNVCSCTWYQTEFLYNVHSGTSRVRFFKVAQFLKRLWGSRISTQFRIRMNVQNSSLNFLPGLTSL